MKASEAYVGQHTLMDAILRQAFRDSDPNTTKDEIKSVAERYLAWAEEKGVPFCLSLLGVLSRRTWEQSRRDSRRMGQVMYDTWVAFEAVHKSIFVKAGQVGADESVLPK